MSNVPDNDPAVPALTRRSARTRRVRRLPASGLPISAFSPPWIRHYIDIGHCRLQKCTNRIRTASDADIGRLPVSFLSMAISASSAYGRRQQEKWLLDYARAVMGRGIDPNDNDDGGKSALGLAAYHGYTELLALLLTSGCSVTTGFFHPRSSVHPLSLAVKNGQHESIRLLFQERPNDIRSLLQKDVTGGTGLFLSSLGVALTRGDHEAVRLLRELGGAQCSDVDICANEGRRKMLNTLQRFYPDTTNILQWSQPLHWSFPTTDRHMLNWLWYTCHRQQDPNSLPSEVWLRVFGFIGRGWWASQRVEEMRGIYSAVDARNVVVGQPTVESQSGSGRQYCE